MDRTSNPPLPLPTPREGPSPFLPGTAIQFAWDSTCLGAFKKCPRYYQLSIIEGWRPTGDQVHLSFGLYYTQALEHYDLVRAEGMNHEDALQEVVYNTMQGTWIVEDHFEPEHGHYQSGYRWEHGASDSKIGNKNFYNLLRSIIWYLDEFGEKDPAVTVIAEDGTPLVERSFRMELGWGPTHQVEKETGRIYTQLNSPDIPGHQPYLLCGHLDRVVHYTGSIFVMDHKTTKTTIGDYYFDQYEPNNQMSLYSIAAKVIFESPVKGVIIDAAQIAVGFTRFARGVTYRTQAQLDEWLVDLGLHLQEAEKYATMGYWPMRDTSCWNCQFNHHDSKICAKDPHVRENFLRARFTKEDPWNPLRVRN